MADIIEHDEIDKDTLDSNTLEQVFSKKYSLLAEQAVTLQNSYINKLCTTKSHKIAICQLDGSAEVYELNNTSIIKVCQLDGHEKTVTEVVFCPKEDHLLYTTAQDGLLKLWDTRSGGSCVREFKDEEEEIIRPYECMDVSCNGRVLCSGSQLVDDDAYLVFWDQRMIKPLGGYWNSHTDEVTQVKFHKERIEILATGAIDGLINVFNIMEQTEDDALTYSLNVDTAIEKLNWLDDKQLACVTQGNDLQLWNTDSGDFIRGYSREKISRSIKRSRGDECYAVDAWRDGDQLRVLAGSYGGQGNVLRSVTISDKKLLPSSNFVENKQVVRACSFLSDNDLLITTGESGIISVWSGTETINESSHKLQEPKDKLHVNRHKPY